MLHGHPPQDMYGYFSDGSGWSPPLWATSGQLFKPLLSKPPWLAAWDRLMRLLVRCVLGGGLWSALQLEAVRPRL